MTSDYQEKCYEYFTRERTNLIRLKETSSNNFDKNIIFLSAGAVALSVTFVKSIEQIVFGEILFASWLLFFISVVFLLISFITSQKAIDYQINHIEKTYLNQDRDANYSNHYDTITGVLNLLGLVFFSFAVLLLLIFCSLNLGV